MESKTVESGIGEILPAFELLKPAAGLVVAANVRFANARSATAARCGALSFGEHLPQPAQNYLYSCCIYAVVPLRVPPLALRAVTSLRMALKPASSSVPDVSSPKLLPLLVQRFAS